MRDMWRQAVPNARPLSYVSRKSQGHVESDPEQVIIPSPSHIQAGMALRWKKSTRSATTPGTEMPSFRVTCKPRSSRTGFRVWIPMTRIPQPCPRLQRQLRPGQVGRSQARIPLKVLEPIPVYPLSASKKLQVEKPGSPATRAATACRRLPPQPPQMMGRVAQFSVGRPTRPLGWDLRFYSSWSFS